MGGHDKDHDGELNEEEQAALKVEMDVATAADAAVEAAKSDSDMSSLNQSDRLLLTRTKWMLERFFVEKEHVFEGDAVIDGGMKKNETTAARIAQRKAALEAAEAAETLRQERIEMGEDVEEVQGTAAEDRRDWATSVLKDPSQDSDSANTATTDDAGGDADAVKRELKAQATADRLLQGHESAEVADPIAAKISPTRVKLDSIRRNVVPQTWKRALAFLHAAFPSKGVLEDDSASTSTNLYGRLVRMREELDLIVLREVKRSMNGPKLRDLEDERDDTKGMGYGIFMDKDVLAGVNSDDEDDGLGEEVDEAEDEWNKVLKVEDRQ